MYTEQELIEILQDAGCAHEEIEQMKIKMSELNGNEKYYYMNQSIPTNNQVGGKIKTGDFRLYDGDCLVWFYKPFTTSYRYTKLGYVKDTNGLKKALGSKNVTVNFTIK